MKTVSMHLHEFEKQNLVSLKGGKDAYKCKICGCEGMRNGFTDLLVVSEINYNKSTKCTFKPITTKIVRPKRVLLEKMSYIGLEEGIYDVIECPEEYKGKYDNDVWVFSDSRNEIVRVLPDEIIEKEY